MNKQIEWLCYDYCLTLGDTISVRLMMTHYPNYTVTKNIFYISMPLEQINCAFA